MREALRPRVDVFGAVDLAGAGVFLEGAQLLFVVGVLLDGLDDQAVHRTVGVLRDPGEASAKLRRKTNRGGFGHGGTKVAPPSRALNLCSSIASRFA